VAQLRFPNPGSDVARIVQVFTLIARDTQGRSEFDLDDMTRIATDHFQASAKGAHGAAAMARSRTKDRSRDSLYNALKMYSEVYRILGWLRPASTKRKLVFTVTLLGEAVAFDGPASPDYLRGLVRESLLAVVFPNEVSDNVGVVSQRPFSWLLRLTARLGGFVTRHEIVLGLLAVVDDRSDTALEVAAAEIERLRRGPVSGMWAAVDEFASRQGVQANTLGNYTRLPVGVLSSEFLGWGVAKRVGLYDGPAVRAVELTAAGRAAATDVASRRDVRLGDLTAGSWPDRAAFATFAYYAMLARAGLGESTVASPLAEAARQATPIRGRLGLAEHGRDLLFSPFVQEVGPVLELAQSWS